MVHLIFVTKYRKELLLEYGKEMKSIFCNIAAKEDLTIISMEVDRDPATSVLNIVRSFKQVSTYQIWRQNNNHIKLKKHFWKEKTFWSDGYFACSVGNASKETIENYIKSQG